MSRLVMTFAEIVLVDKNACLCDGDKNERRCLKNPVNCDTILIIEGLSEKIVVCHTQDCMRHQNEILKVQIKSWIIRWFPCILSFQLTPIETKTGCHVNKTMPTLLTVLVTMYATRISKMSWIMMFRYFAVDVISFLEREGVWSISVVMFSLF